MRLTFYGHSAFQLETQGVVIQIDPFISDNPLASAVTRLEDLAADVILVTHAHGDHFGDTPALAARTGALVLANYEITEYLARHHGITHTQSLNTGGGLDLPWGRVTNTWALHSSSFPDGAYGGMAGGFVVEAEGRCVYVAGDTAPFAEMAWIGDSHDIDLAILPVGDVFTMGPEGSVRAAALLRAAGIVPCHYDTFPPIRVDIRAWAERMRRAGQAPFVLAPGQSMEI
ncbi:MAG: metal-dependent hydrolase [Bacteroidetes bacterium]|nr:metal-dependent hydrolase [Bacteroidota bacterium]MDA0873784.1 metal-dependent hydrolase [Bacteroidota bacterium]